MAILANACQGTTTPAQNRADVNDARGGEMQVLDAANRFVTAQVADAESAGQKFVIVRVAEVQNRRKVPLSFDVAFRSAAGQDVPLGTFSLYPADNPGRFLVATQGKVERNGSIVVRLSGDQAQSSDIRVGVSEIRLGNE